MDSIAGTGCSDDWNLAAWSRTPADDIVIVAIDEQSLREIGRWPWSRRTHAELIRTLSAAGAKAIAAGYRVRRTRRDRSHRGYGIMAALASNSHVVLPVLNEQNYLGGQLLETPPIPALAVAAAGLGHVDVELDPDNIARGVYLKAGLSEPHWPCPWRWPLWQLADAALSGRCPGQRAAGADSSSPYIWRRDYRILIPFAGPPGHFRHVSYRDVVRGTVSPAVFRNQFVLVGATASGLGRYVAHASFRAGATDVRVEFNANVLDALRQDLAIRPLPTGGSPGADRAAGRAATDPVRGLPAPAGRCRWPGWRCCSPSPAALQLLHGAHRWFPPAAALLAPGLELSALELAAPRQMVRSLFEQEERAQVTLDSIGDAVVTTDARGIVHYLNPVAAFLLGGAAAAPRGQPLNVVFQVADERDHHTGVDLIALVFWEQGQPVRLPEPGVLVNRAGQRYAVRASAAPLRDLQGRIAGAVLTFSDITETAARPSR